MQTVELTEFSLLQEANHLGSRSASGIVQTVELTEFSLLLEANHLGSRAASGIVQTVELSELHNTRSSQTSKMVFPLTGGKPSWKSGCFWYCADCRVV